MIAFYYKFNCNFDIENVNDSVAFILIIHIINGGTR